MKISDLKMIETSPTGFVYSGSGDTNLQAGQTITHQGQSLGLIKTIPSGQQFQYLLYSSTELAGDIETETLGITIEFIPNASSLVLTEAEGNFICLHWLNQLNNNDKSRIDCVVLHEQEQFAFRPAPSRFLTPDLPSEMIASLPLLDDLAIISRLCCDQFQPGSFEGDLVDFVDKIQQPDSWIGFLTEKTHGRLTDLIGPPDFWHKL